MSLAHDTKVASDGRAHDLTAGAPDLTIASCKRGTPSGELLRRYWHPIARADEVSDLPVLVKVLDEELVLFRTPLGFGLVYPRCIHRGASLLHAKVEQEGLRCCYHGWLFGLDGTLLEAPCEPAGRVPLGLRQPWYPVVERFGLVWTYMGPSDRQPLFPAIPWMENLGSEDVLLVGGGVNLDPSGDIFPEHQDYNWWHLFDNLMDPFHLYILHSRISGEQLGAAWTGYPDVSFQRLPNGVVNIARRPLSGGDHHYFVSQSLLPNISCSTPLEGRAGAIMIWIVPRDDTSYRTFSLMVGRKPTCSPDNDAGAKPGSRPPPWVGPNKPALEWTTEDHQRWPIDYTVMKWMGDISLHSEEHLTTTDRGISIMRQVFRQQARIVADGGDPEGASRDRARVLEPAQFSREEVDDILAARYPS